MAEEQQEMQEQVQMEDQVKYQREKNETDSFRFLNLQSKFKGDSVPILVDRAKMTPQMRHYLTMSKMQSENAYKGSFKSIDK